MRLFLPAAITLGVVGCVPVFADCFVPQLALADSTVSVIPRPESAECYRIGGSLPGQYTLSRPRYTLAVSTGDRWYAALWLRASDLSGEALRIEGDGIQAATDIFNDPVFPNPRPYDAVALFGKWGALPPPSASPFTLRLRVVAANGDVIGQEVLPFTVIKASHFSTDGL